MNAAKLLLPVLLVVGVGAGVGLAVLGAVTKKLSEPLAWTLGFLSVFFPLGLVIARYIVNKAVYAEAGVPGMRSMAPGISPANMAMALAVTMAPSAGTGGMKKVMGTSSAVAMVAVKPGMAPTNRPNTAEAITTVMT